MKARLSNILLIIATAATFPAVSYAQRNGVDLFPTATPDSTRTVLHITINNNTPDAVFCERLEADVGYAGEGVSLTNPVILDNVLVWSRETAKLRAGDEVYQLIKADIPDIKINSMKELRTTCYEAGFKPFLSAMIAKPTRISNWDKNPLYIDISATEKSLSLATWDTVSGAKEWITINSDLTVARKAQDNSFANSPITSNNYKAGTPEIKALFSRLVTLVQSTELRSTTENNREVRDSLAVILQILSSANSYPRATDAVPPPSSKAEVLYDGESKVFSFGQTWDAWGSNVAERNAEGRKYLRFDLKAKQFWGAAAYVPKNFAYTDLSSFTSLEFSARSSIQGAVKIFLVDMDGSVESEHFEFNVGPQWNTVKINLKELKSSDFNQTRVQALVVASHRIDSANLTIDLDDIVVK